MVIVSMIFSMIGIKLVPEIGCLCLRKDFWYRYGANIASCQKKIYGETVIR